MKYIAFRNRIIPPTKNPYGMISHVRHIKEVYVFEDPDLVKYSSGFVGIRPKQGIYDFWLIEEDIVQKTDSGLLAGIGILNQNLFEINETFNKNLFAKNIGVSLQTLENILN